MVLSFAKGDANIINTQDSFLQTQEPIPIWEKSPPWRVTNLGDEESIFFTE